MKEKPRQTPQTPFRFLPAWWLTLLYALVLGLGFYAVFIEPYWIHVSRFHLSSPKIRRALKVAHLSDLHTHGLHLREKKMLRILESEKPDVILVSGDAIIDSSDYRKVAEVLRELHAPLGVWMVRGNWENALPVQRKVLWGDDAKPEKVFYRGVGVRLLVNSAAALRDDVWLVGFDEPAYGKPDLESALKGVPDSAYRIALFHIPQFFDQVAGKAELSLAGHCHGGQAVLPGFAPFYLPVGCRHYVQGWFERAGSKLYVSRGLGNTILDLRFNAPPELEIFELSPPG